MQIRVANKQDEPLIRAIVFQHLEESGIQPELEGRDSDLRNVEHNYFWYNGLCIVAESDGQIIGVLAARGRQGDEQTLELKRLVVTPGARKRGAARALLKTMLFFAKNMEYKNVVLNFPDFPHFPAGMKQIAGLDGDLLKHLGWTPNELGIWHIPVPDLSKAAVE